MVYPTEFICLSAKANGIDQFKYVLEGIKQTDIVKNSPRLVIKVYGMLNRVNQSMKTNRINQLKYSLEYLKQIDTKKNPTLVIPVLQRIVSPRE